MNTCGKLLCPVIWSSAARCALPRAPSKNHSGPISTRSILHCKSSSSATASLEKGLRPYV
eukprot:7383716-Prymnesium_polylepis.2